MWGVDEELVYFDMKKAITLVIILIIHFSASSQIIWDKVNYPLFPSILNFEILNMDMEASEVEFDFENETIVEIDRTARFEVKNMSAFRDFYIVLEKEPELKKSDIIYAPMREFEKMQGYYRQMIYNDLNLNEIQIELRRGVIYTRDKDTKNLRRDYGEDKVSGKLLWINSANLYLVIEDGNFLYLSDFQIENLTLNRVRYKSVNEVYDVFFGEYKERLVELNQKLISDLKNSSLEELIEQLGAYSSVNNINGRIFVDWNYSFESYELNINNKSSTLSSNVSSSSTNSLWRSTQQGYGSGNIYYSPAYRSAYIDSYYNSNRQTSLYSNTSSNGFTSNISSSQTNGDIIKKRDELAVVIELNSENKVLNVIQKGIIKERVYGRSFSFF